MPSSAVHTFTDPGEYAAAIRATTIDLTVTGRGHFIGKRTRIDLHRLWMQRLSEHISRVVHSASLLDAPSSPSEYMLWSGADLHPANIIRHVEGENAFQRSLGPTFWGAMS